MTKKIFSSIFLVSLLILIASMSFIFYVLYHHSIRVGLQDMKNEANLVSIVYENQQLEDFNQLENTNRITIIERSGKVIYDSKVDETKLENHKNREEIQKALKEGNDESQRYSTTMKTTYLYYAKILNDGNILRISQERESYLALLSDMYWEILAIIFGTLVLSFFIAKNAAEKIVAPLNTVDIKGFEADPVYDELLPFIRVIQKQNQEINDHLQQIETRKIELESIIKNMTEGIILLDPDFNMISYNNTAGDIFSINKEHLGKNFFYCDRSAITRHMLRDLRKGIKYKNTIRRMNRIFDIAARLVHDESRIIGYSIYLRDTTETRNRELMRREFTANITHELKTPLTSISGYAEIIEKDIAKKEDVKKFAHTIYQQAHKLIAMVNDILEISRLESEKYEKAPQDIQIFDLVNEIFEDFQFKTTELNVSLVMEGEDLKICTIRSVFREILSNLIDNAIKYNKQDGYVKICVEPIGDQVRIHCIDTGVGIEEKEVQRIFERFYRIDKSRSKEIEGTGLGLSIVKHGVDLLGGTIKVKSKETTDFIITLPMME